ncbi:calponin-2 [Striga asiatica]|uniref:Calponin-2 n=1 Tax=Striga asiatica TaxID=4170 RepID=A0A5A7R0A3_STRAF|nr:calponin-2 [Striga asiatica]
MIDLSPPSAESSFRELDEVFLQTQTRIWLGEVLCTRFEEELNLSDLLQDGEILFDVSKVVWNLLLVKCMELRHLKHKYGPFGSRKSSGRYRPYSNVDSFIKICKIMGLGGIDLFSPSDVVEKRNIRKVCICIRALSMKARSKQLSVPDFDMVVYSVTMPKNMVDIIRKSLESSQCTVSSSSSYSSRNVSQTKAKQKKFQPPSNEGDDDYSSSDESDEAESRYMGENSFPSVGKFDYTHGLNSDPENSPELENDHKLDKMSACGAISHLERHNPEYCTESTLDNDYSVVGDSSCLDVGESNYISDYLAFSDLMVHATTEGSSSVIRNGENNMFDFFLKVDSQVVASNKKTFQNGDEDTEISSTTSMSSILGRLLNLEFEDQFDEDDSLSTNREHEAEKQFKDKFVLSKPKNVDLNKSNYQAVVFDSGEASEKKDIFVEVSNKETRISCEDLDNENLKYSLLSSDSDSDHWQCGDNGASPDFGCHVSDEKSNFLKFSCDSKSVEGSERCQEQCKNEQDTVVQENLCETISVHLTCFPIKDVNGAQEDIAVAQNIKDDIPFPMAPENGGQDKYIANGMKKHGRRPLLRTVVKGTAIAGILFLLLHIRRKSKGNNGRESKQQYGQVLNYNESKSSSANRQKKNVVKGIYPSEKIRL